MSILRKKICLCIIGALFAATLASCKQKVSPSMIESMTEYVDGVAVATLKYGNSKHYCFVDDDLAMVAPGHNLTRLDDFVDGYAYAESEKRTAVPHFGTRPQWRYVDRNGSILSGNEADKARRSFN